jgi:hypothetical protein
METWYDSPGLGDHTIDSCKRWSNGYTDMSWPAAASIKPFSATNQVWPRVLLSLLGCGGSLNMDHDVTLTCVS